MKLNETQKKIISAALIVFVLSCLYVPYTLSVNGNILISGYQFLWDFSNDEISLKMLFVEWVAIGVVTYGLVYLNKSDE